MTTLEKAAHIERYYGSDYLNGEKIIDFPSNRIYAIYEQMLKDGRFERYENYKESYVALFPNDRYMARIRAEKMSIFELMEAIPQIIFEQTGNFPDGYQYTLFDIMKGEDNGNEDET